MRAPEPATKKEYRAYADKLRHAMKAELKKPEAERDNELIKECETSILYCEERLSELGAGKKRVGFSVKPLRWVAAAAVVVLILGTGIVSYSYGRKALSDDVQWNVRYFNFEGNFFPDDNAEEMTRNEFETHTYDSEDELRAAYGEDLILPGSLTGVYFVSATVHGEPGNSLIRVEYRVNKKPLILEIDTYLHDDDGLHHASETGLYYPDDFTLSHYGSAVVGSGPDCSFVYFQIKERKYILTGGQGTEIVVDIAKHMIRMGRGY